jgi:hypothetical protein
MQTDKTPTTEYQWCEVSLDHLSPSKARKVPKWARRAALSSDGTVFIPAVIAGSEMIIFLCAGYDGTRALVVGEHTYYPADWIAREFPKARETAEKIQRNVLKLFA